jgi:hypothetical protein
VKGIAGKVMVGPASRAEDVIGHVFGATLIARPAQVMGEAARLRRCRILVISAF